MKKLIAGNWKMNGTLDETRTLIADIVNQLYSSDGLMDQCDFAVFPPSLYIPAVRHALHGFPYIAFGAQDCSAEENGAYTGDLSAEMLKDSSCSYVIVGHSERRAGHGETDDIVRVKAQKALDHDLMPIICVGETEEQRAAGDHEKVVSAQLAACLPGDRQSFDEIVVAYEPVWAIGTGKACGPDDIKAIHALIRETVGEKTRILYGGSLKPDNAADILSLPNVDGGLIGGASLDAESFLGIAKTV